jgi:hypothetical protein
MFLRCTRRKKNGKEHRYWNLVENRRVAGGQVVQRQVLYLGEINDSQREVWRKSIEVFEDGRSAPRTVALFAEEQTAPIDDEEVIQVRLKDLEVRNARQWGGCWLVGRGLLPDRKAINDPIHRERWQGDGNPRAPQTGGAS